MQQAGPLAHGDNDFGNALVIRTGREWSALHQIHVARRWHKEDLYVRGGYSSVGHSRLGLQHDGTERGGGLRAFGERDLRRHHSDAGIGNEPGVWRRFGAGRQRQSDGETRVLTFPGHEPELRASLTIGSDLRRLNLAIVCAFRLKHRLQLESSHSLAVSVAGGDRKLDGLGVAEHRRRRVRLHRKPWRPTTDDAYRALGRHLPVRLRGVPESDRLDTWSRASLDLHGGDALGVRSG